MQMFHLNDVPPLLSAPVNVSLDVSGASQSNLGTRNSSLFNKKMNAKKLNAKLSNQFIRLH